MRVMTQGEWNKIWEENNENLTLSRLEQDRIVALVKSLNLENGRILDLGCGDGELAARLKDLGHDVLCADISDFALGQARNKGLKTLQCDLQTIDFTQWEANTYDVVILSHLMEYLIEPQQVAKLALLVLKDDGFFVGVSARPHRQNKIDQEVFSSFAVIDDESLIGMFKTVKSGTFRVEKHNREKNNMLFYGSPPRPTLTLCLMAWNEAPFIRKCIESVPYDELIIGVDDASNDTLSGERVDSVFDSDTYKIAKEYTDAAGMNSQTYTFEHMVAGTESYNFSERRNEGFEKATGDWIIQIDSHEYLNPEAMTLPNDLRWAGEREIFHIVMHRTNQSFHVPHIWKNTGEYKYSNPVHNILTYQDGSTIPSAKRSLMKHVHCFHEWTKDKADERAEQRNKGNIPALLREAEENPDSERPWFFIGNAYLGEEQWDEALDAYDKTIALSKSGQDELIYQCQLLKGKILIHNDRTGEAREVLHGLDAIQHDRSEHLIYLADTYAIEGDFDTAKRFYLMATHFKPPLSCMFVEDDLYGWWLYDRLFKVYAELEQWENSHQMLVKSVSDMPRHEYEKQRVDLVKSFKKLEHNIEQERAA